MQAIRENRENKGKQNKGQSAAVEQTITRIGETAKIGKIGEIERQKISLFLETETSWFRIPQ